MLNARFAATLDAWITRAPAEEPHTCSRCGGHGPLTPASAPVADAGFGLHEGDLLCAVCTADLADDAVLIAAETDELLTIAQERADRYRAAIEAELSAMLDEAAEGWDCGAAVGA
jgi:hypothetical protein